MLTLSSHYDLKTCETRDAPILLLLKIYFSIFRGFILKFNIIHSFNLSWSQVQNNDKISLELYWQGKGPCPNFVQIRSKKKSFHMLALNKSFWSLDRMGCSKSAYGTIFFGANLDTAPKQNTNILLHNTFVVVYTSDQNIGYKNYPAFHHLLFELGRKFPCMPHFFSARTNIFKWS